MGPRTDARTDDWIGIRVDTNLEGGDVGGEAVDAEHHLPGPAALGPRRAAPDLAVVLPDPPPRVHSEPARTNRSIHQPDAQAQEIKGFLMSGETSTRCRCGPCGGGRATGGGSNRRTRRRHRWRHPRFCPCRCRRLRSLPPPPQEANLSVASSCPWPPFPSPSLSLSLSVSM